MLVLVHLLYTWLTAALLSLVLHAVGCGCQPEKMCMSGWCAILHHNLHILISNNTRQTHALTFHRHAAPLCCTASVASDLCAG